MSTMVSVLYFYSVACGDIDATVNRAVLLLSTLQISRTFSIKREIGHLCHDERRPKVGDKPTVTPTGASGTVDLSRTYAPGMFGQFILIFALYSSFI